jgi:hypothetical protein
VGENTMGTYRQFLPDERCRGIVQWDEGSWPNGLPKKDGAIALSGAGSLDTATPQAGETSRAKNLIIEFPEIALNNIVEQDHRAVKRVTRPMLGFKSFDAAQDTLVGIELMHMIKKRQMIMETGEEGLTAAELFYSLAA